MTTPFPTTTTEVVNTYGAHMLVDFKPIEDAEQLLEECEQYIQQTKTALFTLPFVPAFSRVAAGVRMWRSKRRDNRLMLIYNELHPRVVATEKTLRKIIGEVVEKKSALRLQARHLQVRLEACIKHNKMLLESSEAPLEDLRAIVNKLSGESTALKDMITFNKEVLRIKNVEQISKGQNFVRWGSKPNKKKTVMESDIKLDPDHSLIENKLIVIRELREKFVGCLALLLETRGTQQVNLENSDRSLQAISFLIKRGGIGDSEKESGDGDVDVVTFDHSRCADCSYAYSITCDCTNHFAALQKQAQEANQRLQALVEIREKMSETFEQMSLENGGDPRYGSFSSVRDSTVGTPDGTPDTSSKSVDNNS